MIDLIREQDDLKAHEHIFYLWPTKWRAFVNARITGWNTLRLAEPGKDSLPDTPGVYTLLIQPGIAAHPHCSFLMYVGKAMSLRRRFKQYLTSEQRETGRPMIFRLLSLYPDHVWFSYTPTDRRYLDEVEAALISAYIPPCNKDLPADISPVRGAFR